MDWQAIGSVGLHILVGLTMLVGWLGLFIVIIPGLVIIWTAGLVYGLVVGFNTAGWILFGVMTVLMIVGSLIDNVLMGASARKKGASWLSIGAALVGALLGTLLLPPIGGILLALVALFLVEYYRVKDWRQALDSTGSMAMGCGWSVVARLAMGAVMIGLWLLWAFVF
ncbi:MAG: hypothetical protein CL609_25600 [Anaerolineaceae bacterium]|nr:hypothetical protein [Anaerolineaceae bacterium]